MTPHVPAWKVKKALKARENEERQLRAIRKWELAEYVLSMVAAVVLVAIAVMFIILACMNIAHASPLDCEGIKDADQRHFCRALSKPQKSECEFIKDPDLRHQCRARVK